jgi:hypothetical protein
MTSLTESSATVAQAVYTWARAGVDGSKGMGFCAISRSLEASIDWLGRIQPTEFELFQGNVTGAEKLYEARKGFSQVGRTLRGDKAIVYCKTADGAVDDHGRQQPVVHALFSESTVLGLSSIKRIPDNFWRRGIETSAVGALKLDDLSSLDLLTQDDRSAMHSCPADHKRAANLLRVIVEQGFERDGYLELTDSDDVIALVTLAFPEDVAEKFTLNPYVAIDGVRRVLGLSVPNRGIPGLRHPLANAGPKASSFPKTSPGQCGFEAAVEDAAREFLRGKNASLCEYAEATLTMADRPAVTIASRESPEPIHATTAKVVGSSGELDRIIALLAGMREGTDQLTEKACRALAGKIRASHADPALVLELPQETLIEIFANVADKDTVWEWSRLFADVPAETFIDLWNATHVAAFLGIVLLKNLGAAEGEDRKIAADRGINYDATVAVLRSMRGYPRGGQSLARIIHQGFGGSEIMRQFIARTFSQHPDFLFDAVLASVNVSDTQMIDYIRFCYRSWVAHRRIPEREASALLQVLRPTFVHKLKMLIGR